MSGITQCPFAFCEKPIELLSTKPWLMIPAHTMPERFGRDVPCPASLMYWPLSQEATITLVEQMLSMRIRALRIEAQEKQDKILEDWKREHPEDRPPPNVSQSHRSIHRMGREPEPDSPDWALGGREDEDVHDQRTDVTGNVPPTTGGYVFTGRGTGDMATIPEVIAAVNGARSTSGEGLAIIQRIIGQLQYDNLPFQAAIDKLEQAIGIHTSVMDGMGTGSGALMEANGKLVAAITFLNESQEAVAKALMDAGAAARAVAGSHDDDERFIQAIASA